jgi:hypothetical protein
MKSHRRVIHDYTGAANALSYTFIAALPWLSSSRMEFIFCVILSGAFLVMAALNLKKIRLEYLVDDGKEIIVTWKKESTKYLKSDVKYIEPNWKRNSLSIHLNSGIVEEHRMPILSSKLVIHREFPELASPENQIT